MVTGARCRPMLTATTGKIVLIHEQRFVAGCRRLRLKSKTATMFYDEQVAA